MKLKPIGIVPENNKKSFDMKASDFGNKYYDGIQVRQTESGIPVIIMRCKRDEPMRWKVCYGYSQVFFKSFEDAAEFCNSRGMKIMKEQAER